jgi:dipeptidyl aminopeptidase/acylaminoacyl peptidase
VDALIRAHKNFELVVVPGADHGAILPDETLVQEKLVEFFNHHIKGIDPPNTNAGPAAR